MSEQSVANLMGLPPATLVETSSEEHQFPVPIRVGVELEFENGRRLTERGLPNYANNFWDLTHDGSLRNQGVELRFNRPMAGVRLQTALEAMGRMLSADYCSALEVSERCGTHVHVDMRQVQVDKLNILTTAFALMEPYIFEFLGPKRELNPFCPSWYHADPGLINVRRWTRGKIQGSAHWRTCGWQKYTSLNLLPLARQGSVEFRMFPGTADMEMLAFYVHTAQCIARSTFIWDSAEQLLDYCYENGTGAGLESAFAPHPDVLEEYMFVSPDEDVLETSWSIAENLALTPDHNFGLICEHVLSRVEPIIQIPNATAVEDRLYTEARLNVYGDNPVERRLRQEYMEDMGEIDEEVEEDEYYEDDL